MSHLEASAHIPLPAADYWAIRNSPEFFAIECDVLKNSSKVMLEETYDAEGLPVRARLATRPDISFVPQYLQNMIPNEEKAIVFYDEVEYVHDDPTTPYAFKCRTVPNIVPDRADIRGYVRVVPNPDGRTCTQYVTVDLQLNVWGLGTIISTLIGRGVSDGYTKLPAMVERWKTIAAGAFAKELEAEGESQLDWTGSFTETGKSGHHSDDEFFDASDEEERDVSEEVRLHYGAGADDDSGVAHTDSMSESGDAHSDHISSAENLLISRQPGEPTMGGGGEGDFVRMGVERPEDSSSSWGLCGLGGFSLGGWWT